MLFDEQLFITFSQILFPNWIILRVKQNSKKFCTRNKKWYLKYFMNKKDKVLNIVAIRKQILKTFSWTISLKLEIVYYMMKNFNSVMFGTMNWDLKYLTISNNEVINSFAIRWAIIYNCITNSISKLNSLWVKQNLKKICIRNKKWYLNYFMNKKDKVWNIIANRK